MKRHLVVTSHTTITLTQDTHGRQDELIEAATLAERRRLEAYLYGHSTLAAIAFDVERSGGSQSSHGQWVETRRVTLKALVEVTGNDAANARYLADYQSGRLQSGSFGVEDYVEDVLNARIAVLGDGAIPSDEPTLADALQYAVDCLAAEEVEYALGLDDDHLEASYVVVDGIERPRTEADLADELARHRKIVELLRAAAANTF